jgi:hypothetical protein
MADSTLQKEEVTADGEWEGASGLKINVGEISSEDVPR